MFAVEVKCPHCERSLMNESKLIDGHPSIQLKITYGNHNGMIWLSSVYGSYNYEMTFDMKENQIAKFYCPHCDEELIGDLACPECGTQMINLMLKGGGHIHFCPKKNCRGHHIQYDDSNEVLRDAFDHYHYMEPRE